MEFIDKTGHIFSQKSYNEKPIGYNYETNDYVFWINDEFSAGRLSIDTYYILPIRPVIKKQLVNIKSIDIEIESSIFSLISSKDVQNKIESSDNIAKSIEFVENSSDFKKSLNKSDIYIVSDGEYCMIPFYIICNASEESTWTSQVLIHIKFNDNTSDIWCPISVGGVFVDENEPLMINGSNFGINLPKSILNALYQQPINIENANESVYADKVKEYMLNMNTLKYECGNFRSALNAIKWFGYGDKLTLTKLIRTDNEFATLYLRDNFSITNDVISSYKNFASSTLLSLSLKENEDSGNLIEQNFNKDFWGEGMPVLENLFNKLIEYKYDEEDITFYAPYYKWVFSDMLIKMSYLKYYYQKFFLPIHLAVHTAAIEHQCFVNDIKLVTAPFVKWCDKPRLCEDNIRIKLPANHTQYIYTSEHYVDENYNEFTNTKILGEVTADNIFYINELCIAIPIIFTGTDKFFDCTIVLERNTRNIFESHFSFTKNSTVDYKNFVIVPNILNDKQTVNYWLDGEYILNICVNGKWFDYKFKIALPELNISFGKLEYEYNNDLVRQIVSINDSAVDFRSYMYLPTLVDVNNINFPKQVIDYGVKGNMDKFIAQYRECPNLPNSDKYYNRVHYYKVLNVGTGKEIEYTENQDIVALYRQFFNDNGSPKPEFDISLSDFKYDMYLMHDDIDIESYKGILSEETLQNWKPYWYLIYISKDTLDKKTSDLDDVSKKEIQTSNFTIKYQKSDKKFLINRMKYISSEGVNQFNTDDIMVASVNNVDLPFILELGTKWTITPFSLKMENDSGVSSTTNTALIGVGGDNTVYSKGYYNVAVNYSIDGYTQQTISKKCAILVK